MQLKAPLTVLAGTVFAGSIALGTSLFLRPAAARLSARAPVQRALDPGTTHRYEISVQQGQVEEVIVRQLGLDVTLGLLDEDGNELVGFDSPSGGWGEEKLLWVPEFPGRHLLEIRAEEATDRGEYEILRHAPRRATSDDRLRAEAAWDLARAYALRKSGTPFPQQIAAFAPLPDQFRAVGDDERELRSLIQLIRARLEIRQHDGVKAIIDRGVELARRREDVASRAVLSNYRGSVWRQTGKLDQATAAFEEALDLAADAEREDISAIALHNLAVVTYDRDQREEALGLFISLLELGRQRKSLPDIRTALAEIAFLQLSFGEARKAQVALEEALTLSEGDLKHEGLLLLGLGRAWRRLENETEARAALVRCVELWHGLGADYKESIARNELGGVLLAAGRAEAAVRQFKEALALTKKAASADRGAILANLARALDASGDSRAAFVLFDELLRGDPPLPIARTTRASALHGAGLAAEHLGHAEEAADLFEESIELIEELRLATGAKSLKWAFSASKRNYHERYIEVLVDLYREAPKPEAADRLFRALERSRAQALLDRLALGEVRLRDALPEDLRQKSDDLARRIATAEAVLAREGLFARRDATIRKYDEGAVQGLDRRLREYRQLRDEIRRRRPRVAALTEPRILTLAETRRSLPKETQLLIYSLGQHGSFAVVVDRQRLEVVDLPSRSEIESLSRTAADSLRKSGTLLFRHQTKVLTRRLAERILHPVMPLLAGRRLVIMPDGALEAVPFAALPVSKTGDPAWENLGDRHVVSSWPSASVLALLRPPNSNTAQRQRGMALGDPVLSLEDPRLLTKPIGGRRSWQDSDLRRRLEALPRLPETVAETGAVARWGGARQRLGFDADIDFFTAQRLGPLDLLHFATHAVFDPDDLRRTGLVLSLFDRAGNPKPGFLSAAWIYQADFDIDLVVLGACQTGLGADVQGEGFVGLARAFLYAGARAVLVSLWDVDDRATRELMERFYFHLYGQNLQADEALRAAQHDLRRDPAFADPYHWAGFVLQGHGQQTFVAEPGFLASHASSSARDNPSR